MFQTTINMLKTTNLIFLLIFILTWFVKFGFAGRKPNTDTIVCTKDLNNTIYTCVAPVKSFAEILGSTMQSTVQQNTFGPQIHISSNVISIEMFKELCKLIDTFENCIRDARQKCPNHILISLIDASYGYLCSAGYNDFMENAQCLMNLDQDPIVKGCHMHAAQKIASFTNATSTDTNTKKLEMCNTVNNFMACIESRVLQQCGKPAWAVIEKVLKDTTQTLISSCTFSDTFITVLSNSVTSSSTLTTTEATPIITSATKTTKKDWEKDDSYDMNKKNPASSATTLSSYSRQENQRQVGSSDKNRSHPTQSALSLVPMHLSVIIFCSMLSVHFFKRLYCPL